MLVAQNPGSCRPVATATTVYFSLVVTPWQSFRETTPPGSSMASSTSIRDIGPANMRRPDQNVINLPTSTIWLLTWEKSLRIFQGRVSLPNIPPLLFSSNTPSAESSSLYWRKVNSISPIHIFSWLFPWHQAHLGSQRCRTPRRPPLSLPGTDGSCLCPTPMCSKLFPGPSSPDPDLGGEVVSF